MDIPSLLVARLANQQLIQTDIKDAKSIVSWMGAMQAQDFNMAKWGIGVRLLGSTDTEIENTINKGDIIRLHILRPTWHFVSSDDIYWMLDLSASRLSTSLKTADKMLDLTPEFVSKTYSILIDILDKEPNLTRQEIGEKLNLNNSILDSHRLNCIMFHAEVDSIVCNGVVKGKKQTYDLLEKKVPKGNEVFNKEESLYKLARKYFQSHGPATLQDFVWWSGLTIKEAKTGIESIMPDFIQEVIEGQTYIFHNSTVNHKLEDDIVHLLPAFDELFVSYKDRKEILKLEHQKKVIISNGVFKPTVFLNGEIIGIWNRVVKKNRIISDISCFKNPSKKIQGLISQAATDFDKYMMNP